MIHGNDVIMKTQRKYVHNDKDLETMSDVRIFKTSIIIALGILNRAHTIWNHAIMCMRATPYQVCDIIAIVLSISNQNENRMRNSRRT